MEEVDIVDSNDNIIGKCTRHHSYKERLNNRIVDIVILNKDGKIALQRRSKTCNFMPLAYGISAGGHVSSGENYLEAAKKEMEEEIGISCDLKVVSKDFLDRKYVDKKYQKNKSLIRTESHCYFRIVYEGTYEGKFNFNDGEVESIEFFNLKEIRSMINKGEYMTSGCIDILERYYLN